MKEKGKSSCKNNPGIGKFVDAAKEPLEPENPRKKVFVLHS